MKLNLDIGLKFILCKVQNPKKERIKILTFRI